MGKMRHLGMKTAPSKSTPSYANAQRSWQMYNNFIDIRFSINLSKEPNPCDFKRQEQDFG
jgi:hypothetical protein